MTSSIETDDGWSGPCATIARKEEDWEKESCGCAKCYPDNYWDPKKVPEFGQCYKKIAYEAQLEVKAKQRFSPEVDMTGFKPASREQIAEWQAWLSSSGAAEAHEELIKTTEAAMRAWKDYKFDPVAMEHHVGGMWPAEQAKYKLGPMWTAYDNYGKEQYKLLKAYNAIKDTKSEKEFDKAENAYNGLMKHIREHGDIVLLKDMTKQHKQPSKAELTAAPKLGRRAARKLRNVSESSSGSISRADVMASKVTTKQGYEAE